MKPDRFAAGPNTFNGMLRDQAAALVGAYRGPISPGCSLPTAAATTAPATPPTPPATVQRSTLLRVPIKVSAAGDNLIIPTLTGRKLIYELFLWNVAAQTLAAYQGPSASGILLFQLTDYPALTGLFLGFNGNFAQPHFEIDNGQPFVLNLGAATEVDGFCVYRIATDSF